MSPSSMLEALHRTLVKHGVSRSYAERYTFELRDHFHDLCSELQADGMPMEDAERQAAKRLGNLETLSHAALLHYRRRTLAGRHAWLFFGVFPLILSPVSMTLLFILFLLPLALVGGLDNHAIRDQTISFARMICSFSAYVVPGLLAAVIYRSAWRCALNTKWRLFACFCPIAWGAWLRFNVFVYQHRGGISMGALPRPVIWQAATACAIVLLYILLAKRSRRSLHITA